MNQDKQEKPIHFELKKKPDIEIDVSGVIHYYYLIPFDEIPEKRLQDYVNGQMLISSGLTSMQLDSALDIMYQVLSDKNKRYETKIEEMKGFIAALQTRRGMMNSDTFISAMTCFLVSEKESIKDWSVDAARHNASILLKDIDAVFFCGKKFMKLYKPSKGLSTEEITSILRREMFLTLPQQILF